MTNNKMRKIKYTLKCIASTISWSLLVCLFLFVGLFGYYFCASKVYEKKGYGYAPLYSFYTIVSPSMVPTINVYDMIINFKVNGPSEVNVGDIITFTSASNVSKGLTVTHRINDMQIVNGEYQYITKGDNNSDIDSSPAFYQSIIGKTVAKIPGFGKIQKFVGSAYGWLILILLPALIILLSDVYKLVKISHVKKSSSRANKKLVAKMENK